MISVQDVNNLNSEDEVKIALEEARIDAELTTRGAVYTSCIPIPAPKDLNHKSSSALKEKYRQGGWYIKEFSDYQGSYWRFYLTPPAEDYYSK